MKINSDRALFARRRLRLGAGLGLALWAVVFAMGCGGGSPAAGPLAVPATAVAEATSLPVATPVAVPTATVSGSEVGKYATVATAVAAVLDEAAADGRFSGAALVARDGVVLVQQGYGQANAGSGTPNTPDAIFLIGSLTKQFTAAAILLLQEEGLLAVGDPLARYVPDYPGGEGITLHHLLNHTAGVVDYTNAPGFPATVGRPHSVDELIATFSGRQPEFAPGSRFAYSNSNYILLGKVIEVVSGRPYGEFVESELFRPAGMARSGYGEGARLLPGRAEGYRRAGAGGLQPAVEVDMSVPYAAGALYSTVNDLYLWDRVLRDGAVLAPASRAAMFAEEEAEYGYGWGLEVRDGRRLAFHGGWIPGYASHIVRWLDDDGVIILLSNVENAPVRPLVEELKGVLFADAG